MRLDRRLEDSLTQIATMLQQAAHEGVDLVLFPECALTGYDLDYIGGLSRLELEQAIDSVKEAVREASCLTVLGTPTYDLEGRRNSALLITREGRAGALYHKVQLVGDEAELFLPGNRIGYFEEGGVTGGLLVCHDGRYPELTRLPVMMGARLLCHASAGVDSVTSLAWKGLTGAQGAHPVQTDTFYLYANAVGGSRDGRRYARGRSAVLHPTGLTLIRADEREEALLTTHVDLKEAQARWPLKSLEHPAFLREHWERMVEAARRSIRPGQLRMTKTNLARLARPRVAEGYRLRTYRPGDEADWARLIRTYIGGEWDAESTRANLTGQERFFPDGLFFVESAVAGTRIPAPTVVGTACAWRPSAQEWEEGELHMVAVDERHRGHGLGRALCLAVLRYFREKGFKRVRLSTDDFRLAAIKVYLDLGFAPVIVDELHRQRWQDIHAALAAPR
jgi:mycothiol synthase